MKQKKYKFAIVVNSLGYGGNERSAINIAKYLPSDIDTTIIIQENNYSIPYDGNVYSLECPCKKSMIGKILNAVKRLIKLKKYIKKQNYDCVLIILPVSNIINYAKFKCKKIVSCREYGDLKRHFNLYVKMAKKSDYIVFNSREQENYFTENCIDVRNKTKTIYNILDIDLIQKQASEPPQNDFLEYINGKKIVISVGRFAEQKGFCNLLKAFKIVAEREDDARLVMIGDGLLRPQIEQLIIELNLKEKVLLLGFKKDLYKFLAKSKVFTMSSYSEGFPNVLIEALACGIPVISTDCPSGPAEILSVDPTERVKKGYLVSNYGIRTMEFERNENSWDPNHIDESHLAFAEAILQVLNNDELQSQLKNRGLTRIEEFRSKKIVNQWERLIR